MWRAAETSGKGEGCCEDGKCGDVRVTDVRDTVESKIDGVTEYGLTQEIPVC